MNKPRLLRITTAPISMRLLITGQPSYMKDAGFDVTLVSAEGSDWDAIPELDKFTVHKVDMARQINIKKDIRALFTLIKLFRKIKPDIVHSHTPKAGLLGMIAAKVTGVPVRIHTLAGMPLMTASGLKRKILFRAEKATFSASNETWPNSKQLLHFVLNNKMIASGKARMILNGSSNGIDLTKFSRETIDPQRAAGLKTKYNINENDFSFLAVGRMVNDKGINELVHAFQQIHEQYNNAKLVLLGPFETADGLPEATIQIIKTHPAIVHVDWSDEVEYFMSFCQCFVHASHREGFPGVVLQAGAMGIPIICSDIPGNIDIVENDSEGIVYPVKDKNKLFNSMQLVLNQYDFAKERAAVLEKKIKENYDRRAVHRAIKERYVQLLQQNKIDVSNIQ